jgi:hypothetical protein
MPAKYIVNSTGKISDIAIQALACPDLTSASGQIQSQIIGARVQVEGSTNLTITYDPEQNNNAPIPPRVWLAE